MSEQLPTAEKDALARALCKADGKVYWTEHIPACYRIQADALIADGWRVLPPGGRPITTDDCTGASDCGSGIHIHGCFADLDGSACDDPTEHSVLPPGGGRA